MAKLESTAVMIERLSGMLGTEDLKAHEQDFVAKLVDMKEANTLPRLSEKQLDWLLALHKRLFA